MHKKVFQCDPLVTPESIPRAAKQVIRLQLKQQKLSFEQHVGVIVLKKVGVTALSPNNPLMSLHSLLDRGVEVDGQFLHLCIIGISEGGWIHRIPIERLVFRVSDTFKFSSNWQAIILGSSRGDRKRTQTGTVERLSSVLSSLTSILSNTIISDPRHNYYGLRDYYEL